MGDDNAIIRAASNGDIEGVRRQLSLGISLARAIFDRSCTGDVDALRVLLEAGGTGEVNARGDAGCTALGGAAARGEVKVALLLLAAGADPDRRVLNDYFNHTPLQLASGVGATANPTWLAPTHPAILHVLLRGGATLPPDTDHPYLRKVAAAGGFRAYEEAHRRALFTTFASMFPRLPIRVTAQFVTFWAHVGYY